MQDKNNLEKIEDNFFLTRSELFIKARIKNDRAANFNDAVKAAQSRIIFLPSAHSSFGHHCRIATLFFAPVKSSDCPVAFDANKTR